MAVNGAYVFISIYLKLFMTAAADLSFSQYCFKMALSVEPYLSHTVTTSISYPTLYSPVYECHVLKKFSKI